MGVGVSIPGDLTVGIDEDRIVCDKHVMWLTIRSSSCCRCDRCQAGGESGGRSCRCWLNFAACLHAVRSRRNEITTARSNGRVLGHRAASLSCQHDRVRSEVGMA